MGCGVIARELEQMGCKTKRNNSTWADTTVMGILKNEKYIGDIGQGKTFKVDPISKRRFDNFGEEDQFYIHEHHEPIISKDEFECAQAIIRRRSTNKKHRMEKEENIAENLHLVLCLSVDFVEVIFHEYVGIQELIIKK